jgi:hypothetical protein
MELGLHQARRSGPARTGRAGLSFNRKQGRRETALALREHSWVLLSLHDPAASGALRNRPFAARRFGGPFLGSGHSAASAFLSHRYGILDCFRTFNCGRDDLPPGGVLLWGVTLPHAAPVRSSWQGRNRYPSPSGCDHHCGEPKSLRPISSPRAQCSKEVTEADAFLCDLDSSLCALCVQLRFRGRVERESRVRREPEASRQGNAP